ncbi:hypothetical protein GCM10010405_36430 [Streptomyces macrosporus]|uniref:Uncharacterized protein n=1 Tax=Streptomyces macrosporus TaxID=44032 RepID=A0ABP5XG34_9ACTN
MFQVRGAGAPGDGAGLVDQFGGGADWVGDDGEEPGVELGLGGLVGQALGLGDGLQAVVVPSEMEPFHMTGG